MPGANFQALLAGRAPPTVSYRTVANQGSGASTYNFNSQDIGTATPDRAVIVAIGNGFGSHTVTSVTIGGVSASQIVTLTGGTVTACLWIARVPTGTTATITVNLSGNVGLGIGIGVWAAYGLIGLTPIASGSSSASPGSVALSSTRPGGFAIAYRATGGSVSAMTPTNFTERFDGNFAGSDKHQGGDAVTSGGALTLTSTTVSGGDANRAMVAAAW